MIDPARLARVEKIMSAPHLAARVHSVTFFLSAHETNYDTHFAANIDEERDHAGCDTQDTYAMEQCDQHTWKIEGLSVECWKLIDSIVDLVSAAAKCSLKVDCVEEDATWHRTTSCHPLLAREFRDRALSKGCQVNGLLITDQFALRASHFQWRGPYQHDASGLRHFSYDMLPQTEDYLLSPQAQEHWRIVDIVLDSADGLDILELHEHGNESDVANGPVLLDLCTRALSKSKLHGLRILKSTGINLSETTLVHTLKRCANTLVELYFGCLGITG